MAHLHNCTCWVSFKGGGGGGAKTQVPPPTETLVYPVLQANHAAEDRHQCDIHSIQHR